MNRKRIKQLIDLFETLPDEKVDMRYLVSDENVEHSTPMREALQKCGTAACIAGWTATLYKGDEPQVQDWFLQRAGDYLGLSYDDYSALFCPLGFGVEGLYTRTDAITTLKHLLETGEVRWPEKVA